MHGTWAGGTGTGMFHVKHVEMKGAKVSRRLALIEETLGRRLGPEERRAWAQYLALFEGWSARTNLVSAADRSRWVERHVEPSLELGKALGFPVRGTVLDLGTGAGFPGIPLALAYPETDFVLVDAKRWRVLFLEEVVETLGLTNVQVELERVESPAFQARWRRQFALAVARAVADLATLWEWSRELLRDEGFLASVKGAEEMEGELKELERQYGDEVAVEVEEMDAKKGSVLLRVGKRKRREVVA